MSTKYYASPLIATRRRSPAERLCLWVKEKFRSKPKKLRTSAADAVQALVKALEAGTYEAASMKVTGGPLQIEAIQPTMERVVFQSNDLHLNRKTRRQRMN